MLRNLIIRGFIACFSLAVVAAIAVGGCIWLVFQEPSFYAELRNQQFSKVEQEAVQARLESLAESIERWALAQGQSARSEIKGSERDRDSTTESKAFTFSQDDLNASLATKNTSRGDFRNLRAQILDDRIRFAGELYLAKETPTVVSADFRLSKAVDEKLKLEIVGGKLGRLPVPIQWILQSLPDNAFPAQRKIDFRFSDNVPHVLLDVADPTHSRPVIKQVKITNGMVTLEMGAPVVAF